MAELFDKVKQFVKKSFRGKEPGGQIVHFERTVYWVQKLNPSADKALLIAAFAHDIERAYRSREIMKNLREVKFTDKKRMREHQEKGAQIIGRFLEQENAPRELIKRVKDLISKHEEGGDEGQNILKDADSISFLENNIKIFLQMAEKIGKKKIRQKFDWMYNRITSEQAKQIANKWYKKAIEELENI